MRVIKIGVIGLGEVSQAHIAAIAALPQAKLVSVCDAAPKVVARVAAETGAVPFTDPADLLRAGGIDLVLVLTPCATHRQIVAQAAAAGIDVFCEKPLALTVEDGEAMVTGCKAAGVRLFYGSCYRYLPAVRAAKAMIDQDRIGRIQLMSETVIGGRGPAGYRQLSPVHYPVGGPGGSGMSLIDHGIHLIDVFAWFTGEQSISAVGKAQISGAPADSEYLLLTYPSGATGHLLYNNATFSAALPNEGMFTGGSAWTTEGGLVTGGGWLNDPGCITVWGSKGVLRIFHYANVLYANVGDGPQRIALEGRASLGHFTTQLEACLLAIVEDRAPDLPGEIGLAALRSLLPVYRQ